MFIGMAKNRTRSFVKMVKAKLLATAYVNLIESDGEVKFEYGYELDKLKVSLNDIGMFLSFLCTFQSRA